VSTLSISTLAAVSEFQLSGHFLDIPTAATAALLGAGEVGHQGGSEECCTGNKGNNLTFHIRFDLRQVRFMSVSNLLLDVSMLGEVRRAVGDVPEAIVLTWRTNPVTKVPIASMRLVAGVAKCNRARLYVAS
jgi:hypothetical protein